MFHVEAVVAGGRLALAEAELRILELPSGCRECVLGCEDKQDAVPKP
jgi:hypothetical protein